MKTLSLRKQVYDACNENWHKQIGKIIQFVEYLDEPVPASKIGNFLSFKEIEETTDKNISQAARRAWTILGKQVFFSDFTGQIKPEENLIKTVEFWYLPSPGKNGLSRVALLTTFYAEVKKKDLTYHLIEQYSPSNPKSDLVNEVYWRYLGRFGTYVPVYAAIPFSTPQDLVVYPKLEEVEMIGQMFQIKDKEITPLLKARTLDHMLSLGMKIEPRTSSWGKWWLKKEVFTRLLSRRN